MKIPDELNQAIEEQIKKFDIKILKKDAQILSDRYLNKERTGKTLLSEDSEALAYSIMRMPATYGAVTTAFNNVLEIINSNNFNSILDIGAGTGAGEWALSNLIEFEKIICLERENAMRKLGQNLLKNNSNFQKIEWINKDITKDELPEADVVIVSYVINELSPEERQKIIDKILSIDSKLVLIIEPGTPEGFKNIKQIRKIAVDSGKFIVAPCTTCKECKLPENDWCHSTVRVERTKIHKLLKSADLPYEDEKFSYIAISKEKYEMAESRILRHPIIEPGKITLKLCTNGNIEEKIITKKDKENFKIAKKKKCGDKF